MTAMASDRWRAPVGVGLLAAQIPGLNTIPDKVGKIIQGLDVPSLLYSAAFAVKGKIPNLQELLKRSPAALSQKVPLGKGQKLWLMVGPDGKAQLVTGDPKKVDRKTPKIDRAIAAGNVVLKDHRGASLPNARWQG